MSDIERMLTMALTWSGNPLDRASQVAYPTKEHPQPFHSFQSVAGSGVGRFIDRVVHRLSTWQRNSWTNRGAIAAFVDRRQESAADNGDVEVPYIGGAAVNLRPEPGARHPGYPPSDERRDDEGRQFDHEHARAYEAGETFAQRLEMAGHDHDAAAVREIRRRMARHIAVGDCLSDATADALTHRALQLEDEVGDGR